MMKLLILISALACSFEFVSANDLMKRGIFNKLTGGVSIYNKGELREWADPTKIQLILTKTSKIAKCTSDETGSKASQNDLMVCETRAELYGKYSKYMTAMKMYAEKVKIIFPSKSTRATTKLQKNANKLNNNIQDDYQKIQTKIKNAGMFFANFDSMHGSKTMGKNSKISTGMFSSVKIKDVQMYGFYMVLKTKRVNVYIGSLANGVEPTSEPVASEPIASKPVTSEPKQSESQGTSEESKDEESDSVVDQTSSRNRETGKQGGALAGEATEEIGEGSDSLEDASEDMSEFDE